MGFGKDGKGTMIREDVSITLGALANSAGVQGDSPFLTEDFRVLKTIAQVGGNGVTAGEGAGLLLFLTNGELSTGEVEQAIELSGPVDRNDRLGTEQAGRYVTLVGYSDVVAGADNIISFRDVNTNSPILTIKPRWTFSDPEGWDWFVYNTAGALTTGGAVRVIATHYGVWVT